jgi:hypothetical protein
MSISLFAAFPVPYNVTLPIKALHLLLWSASKITP